MTVIEQQLFCNAPFCFRHPEERVSCKPSAVNGVPDTVKQDKIIADTFIDKKVYALVTVLLITGFEKQISKFK